MKTNIPSAVALALSCAGLLATPGIGRAQATAACGPEMRKGRYVFTATGFIRPPASARGTAWVPKAILEVIAF